MLERQTKNVIYNYICINRHFHNYRLPSKNKPLVLECEHWLFAKDRQLIAERFLWLIEKKEKNAIHSPKISASNFDYELFILLLTKYKKKKSCYHTSHPMWANSDHLSYHEAHFLCPRETNKNYQRKQHHQRQQFFTLK